MLAMCSDRHVADCHAIGDPKAGRKAQQSFEMIGL